MFTTSDESNRPANPAPTQEATRMPRYSIEWSGTITRDIGWAEIEAETTDDARDTYLRDHPMRRVRSVIEVSSGNFDTITPASADGSPDNQTT